ncbi:MAG: phosphomannomutase [bacterium]|nr:phosphomannomutase [bacterium]
MSETRLSCFKAYDVRGRVPDELNLDLATQIGRAYARFVRPERVVVGHDIRLSSPDMAAAVVRGLQAEGVHVLDLGQCGTEQVYHATFHLKLGGGIMVTASHNPKDHNGLKLVREDARPISSDTGLRDIEQMIVGGELGDAPGGGTLEPVALDAEYVEHLCTYVDRSALRPLKVVVNAGNGGAGKVIDLLEPHLPFEFVKRNHEPDGNFPNGVPNPLLPDHREATASVVRSAGADLGIAWDGDFDRCFLFDEKGEFIEGYYIVGLLAASILGRHRGGKVVHDPRMTWNTLEMVEQSGGVAVQSKSGHAFVKEVMRNEDAVYGGEMSAHHFFREFSYCDSGMIPWMLVAELMSSSGKTLGELVGERVRRFPASGEINRRVDDAKAVIERIRSHYAPQSLGVDETDGVGIEFEDWRFNLRMSNTEPLIRLNVESRGDEALMQAKTQEVLDLMQ